MPLTVLSVAFPFAAVGPASVGGAEQILSDLDRALVAAGHRSIVIACQGSQIAGSLISVSASADVDPARQAAARARMQAAIKRVVASEQPDLIHMHGLDFHEYRLPERTPIIVTLHLPIAWYPANTWNTCGVNVHFCCVSESQRRTCPPIFTNVQVIENGVVLPPLPPQQPREDFALVLGRICPEKNAHEALQAGTRAGVPVLLAGQVFPYPEHQRYFEEKIAPLLDANGPTHHRFLGPIGPEQRDRLLAGAKCLLHPTLAPETSSLVAMEALAEGTPVIAYPSGALPEIIEDGVTGFLVNGVAQMAEALGRVGTLSAAACRAVAERRFDKQRMVHRYFDLYRSLAHADHRQVLHA